MNILSVYIDDVLSRKAMKPNIYLCKPDKERIRKLKDIYEVKLHLKLGAINELSFTIPPFIDRNHELVKNPLISKIKPHYFIELEFKNSTEYFTVLSQNKSMSNDGESISYNLYSSGYLLNNKLIKSYEATSYALSQLVIDFLSETDWSLGFVDVDFDSNNSNALRRSYEVDSSTVLQCLYDIAVKFNALIVFDTINQKVSFYNPDKLGLNRGLKFKDDKYLESYNVDINVDELTTRMYCYGSEGLEFRSLSPTGSNYLEDFTWYMHPFKCDDNYNVIEHSEYMSDALCIAITKYNKLIKEKSGEFDTLSKNLTDKNAELITLNQELSVLSSELTVFNLELDVINATYADVAPTRPDWQAVMAKINAKKLEIQNKNNTINTKKSEIQVVENNTNTLKNLLLVENNFTRNELLELNKYISSRDFMDDTISDEKDLLDASISHFKNVTQPSITMTMSVVNFLNDLEYVADRDKINLGDTVRLKSETLEVSISSKIIEVVYDFNNEDISLTIANEKDLVDDNSKLVDMIYSSANTSTMVNLNKYKFDLAVNADNMVTQILNSEFDTAKNVLVGGYENSNTMNERGFYSRDLQDSNAYLVINNGIIAITADSGNSIEVAISKNGVVAKRLVGNIILGNNLLIESDSGVLSSNGATTTIYDANKVKKVELGRYNDPNNPSTYKYGLRIYDGALDIRTSANQNQGIQLDNSGFRSFNNNGVRTFNVNAITGQVEIVGDLSIKSSTSSNRGVIIDGNGIRGYNSSGTRVFEIDNGGNAYFGGRLDYASGNVSNVGGTVNNLGGTFAGTLNGVNGTFTGSLSAASGTFQGLVTGSLSAQTMSAITIDAQQITTGKLEANRINANTLSAISADLGTINSGTINAVTINSARINSANIDISESIKIGQKITFSDLTSINSGGGNISIEAWSNVNYSAVRHYFNGTVDFSGANVIGIGGNQNYAIAHTNGIGIAYSAGSKRLYVRINGSDVGYVNLT